MVMGSQLSYSVHDRMCMVNEAQKRNASSKVWHSIARERSERASESARCHTVLSEFVLGQKTR